MAANEARRDLAEKIRLERLLAKDMRGFNRKLTRLMVRSQAEGTGVLDAATFQPELTGILEDHYNRVAPEFDGEITKILPEDIEATETETDAIAAAMATFFAGRAPEQATIITNTNQRDITASIDQAIDISQEEAAAGRPQTRIDIAMVSGAILSRKLSGRITGIAALETQAAAETAKATEVQVLTGQPPSVTGGTLRETTVTKEWVTVGDEKVREAHVAADSQVVTLNQPFRVGGQLLRWPGDTSLGATAGNVINCLHPDSIVDASRIKALTRRHYEGLMIRIKLPYRNYLTVTPNHPVLTVNGWVLAKDIDNGCRVVGRFDGNVPMEDVDVEDVKSTIEQEFESLSVSGIFTVGKDSAIVDFHGEIPDHDVDIVYPDSFLGSIGETHITDSINEEFFAFTDFGKGKFFSDCLLKSRSMKKVISLCSDGIMGFSGKFNSLFGGRLGHSVEHSFRFSTRFNASSFKGFFDGASTVTCALMDSFHGKPFLIIRQYLRENCLKMVCIPGTIGGISGPHATMTQNGLAATVHRNTEFFRARGDRRPGRVESVDVCGIDHIKYSGYVYNLETESNIYFSQGVINHNCRCSSVVSRDNVFAERRRRGEAPSIDRTVSEQLETSLGAPGVGQNIP